ncbi:hypothetical protein ABMA28_010573 [Loxostege sticticalis]|uniref:Reverse transcriptase domain-containing protein n=1 Tax=Loxostege sticticalis TaxID=481309 RepID=A0ABD0SAV0_LOXSC
MQRLLKENRGMDRASPHNDAQTHRPTSATNGLGLSDHGRIRLKKLVPQSNQKVRFATLNVGTLTGRTKELADLFKRRRLDFICLQETKWQGSKSRNIGEGYKLMYTGSQGNRNGVAIAIRQEHLDNIIEVKRFINIVAAYAPQVGCTKAEKDQFWTLLDDIWLEIPKNEITVVGGDLNGHVGSKYKPCQRIHGGHGYGSTNEEGKAIMQSAIDYIMLNRALVGRVTNCKVIPGECVVPQHRIVVMDMSFQAKSRPRKEKEPELTRWWLLKGRKADDFREELKDLNIPEDIENDVNASWSHLQTKILKAANKVLGRTRGGKRIPKETWWWSEPVQVAIKKKKEAFKTWQTTKTDADRGVYKDRKKEARKVVAIARSEATKELYNSLETKDGQKLIYKLAKARNQATKDVAKTKIVKGQDGTLLYHDSDILETWYKYYDQLLNPNTTTTNTCLPEADRNLGLVPPITPQEVKLSLKKMSNKKAMGPDGIPVEAWKCLGDPVFVLLANYFTRMLLEAKTMPEAWRLSTIVPLYKGKGSRYECNNYRGIKLMCHTMKLYERVIDSRLRMECSLSENQYGFVPGLSTIDPTFAMTQIAEEYRAKDEPFYVAFLDMEKAFDRVPRSTIWWSLRTRNVPEAYVSIIADMYKDARSFIRTTAGVTKSIPVTEGVHQGSVLSPYLFSLVLDTLTEVAQKKASWTFIYADDVAICTSNRQDLVEALAAWKQQLEAGGLVLSVAKTQYMECNVPTPSSDPIVVDGQTVQQCEEYKYLGSMIHRSGQLESNIQHLDAVISPLSHPEDPRVKQNNTSASCTLCSHLRVTHCS